MSKSKFIPEYNPEPIAMDSDPEDLFNIFKKPEPTVPCTKCKKLFKAENETMVWEDRFPNYCRECYIEAVNANPTEEIIREWAEESIDRSEGNLDYVIPFDCNYKNFKEKVEPAIEEILKEREHQRERKHFQAKIDEAEELYEQAWSTCDEEGKSYNYRSPSMNRIITINLVARLLDRIEKLENRRVFDDQKFSI